MPLDHDAQRVLELMQGLGRPPIETLSPAEARQAARKGTALLAPKPPELREVRDLDVKLEGRDIRVRLYRPFDAADRDGSDSARTLPLYIYFHGGGWVFGDLDTHDGICRQVAAAAECVVAAVDYRLAPEHKFPAAVEDAAEAVDWLIGHAEQLGGDPHRVSIGGDSAGANLAAVVSLMERDRGGQRLRLQVLVYPAVDQRMVYESYRSRSEGFTLTTPAMLWFRDHYLRTPADRGIGGPRPCLPPISRACRPY